MQRVRQIRQGLRRIPGALDGEGLFEMQGLGPHHVLWDPEDTEEIKSAQLADYPTDRQQESSHSETNLIPIVEVAPEIDEDLSRPLLGESEGAEVAARAYVRGIDALAWYMPFHQERFQWGCYLSAKGILAIADALLPLKLMPSRRIQLAAHALVRHEMMHFAVEYMASQWELSVGAPCYLRGRSKLKDEELGFIQSEEMAANAYMLRGFRYPVESMRSSGAFDLIRRYTDAMPPGYSHGQLCVEKQSFQGCLADLAHDHAVSFPSQTFFPSPIGLDLLALYPDRTNFDHRYVPVFFITDTTVQVLSSLVLRFIPSVNVIEENKIFSKALSRMGADTQIKWQETKKKLARSTSIPGLDFKPWRDGGSDAFSVRVTRSIRAHLRLNKDVATWTAYEIGQHKEVGHG